MDADFRIVAANTAFIERWAALTADPGRLQGASLSLLSSPSERTRFRRELQRHRQAGMEPFSVTLTAPSATVDLAPLGRTVSCGWLVTLRERPDAAGVAASGSMTAQLTAAVAHDMKTPLQAVLGWVSLLRKKPLDAERLDEVLTIVERNARLQAEMIDDLLKATRLDGADLPLRREFVDLMELVQQVVESLRAVAERDRITVTAAASGTPVTVWGDARRLMRVVSNLIENAIKFSEQGGNIECRLSVDAGWARLVVHDEGRGITRAFLPSVFDAYRRERRTDRRTADGAGLGLTVVRHLVQLHGGTVYAESDGPGRGSTFTVTLPCVSYHPEMVAVQSGSRTRY